MPKNVPMRGLPLCLALCLLPLSAMAAEQSHEPWSAQCVQTKRLHDGDTLTCVGDPDDRGTFIVRFAGIDAPETGQAYWRASRDRLRELAVPGTVAHCYKLDRYGRELCHLKSAAGTDLADLMIGEGLAWHSAKYAAEQSPDERNRYASLEVRARKERKGLWSEPDPQAPWDCRADRKQHLRCR